MQCYFVKSFEEKLTIDKMKFRKDDDGVFKDFFQKFLTNENEIVLLEFCLFVTGKREFPRTSQITVTIDKDSDAIFSSTCENALTIPKVAYEYEDFVTFLKIAMVAKKGEQFNTV